MLLIGSQALKQVLGTNDEPKDFDFIAQEWEYDWLRNSILGDKIVHTKETRKGFALFVIGCGPVEIDIATPGSSSMELLRLLTDYEIHNHPATQFIASEPFVHPVLRSHRVAGLETLYALKMSHRYLKNSPHFKKTMRDIHTMRHVRNGDSDAVHDVLKDWYKERMKETYDYQHPKLNQSKNSFFSDDGVNYVYDHDTIHEAVKTLEIPAFQFIKEDQADVFCSKEKFMISPEHVKLATVLEESYVLALERCLIPFDFKATPEWAFSKALEKVCTSIASGWWREYAWENYDNVVRLFDANYVDKFKAALAAGKIEPYKKEMAA